MAKKKVDDNMIDIGGVIFILDLEKFSDILSSGEHDSTAKESETKTNYDEAGTALGATMTTREYEKGKEVDAPKYDVLKMCLEIILTYNEEVDDSLGLERALGSTTIPFKVAFNTLLNYEILKEVE